MTLPAKIGNRQIAIRQAEGGTADYVPHISFDDVRHMCEHLSERDRLLVQTLFDGCLRASEAIRLLPLHLHYQDDGWIIHVFGKGDKASIVAISSSLAAQLQAYAYREKLDKADKFFPINRHRVYQIVSTAIKKAGIVKPEHVGAVHVLRHSGALERLKQTGNPKAVQDQLRHKSALMTLRYMKTLAHEESIKIQQGVDLKW